MTQTRPRPAELDFNNTEVAFASMSNYELEQAYWLFKTMGNPWLVKYGPKFAAYSLKLGLPVKGMIKATIFRQFCGGETIEDCRETIDGLKAAGIGTILDYSVEGQHTESDMEWTTDEVARTIDLAAVDPGIPYCVFKVTGVARFGLLEKADRGAQLNSEEKAELARVERRVERLCKHAYEKKVRLFVDAEESWIQETIDRMVLDMMRRYNKERPIVFNTFQMYRRDRLDLLKKWYEIARTENFFIGIKLVRGAYMEKENDRAARMGYTSPIYPTKADTDRAYDDALRFVAAHFDRVAICAGTHNEASARLLAQLIGERQSDDAAKHASFAQLLGMSDNLSYNLVHAGYSVAKYVPYGPVRDVLPYLSRRAEENSSIKGQTGRELMLIERELKRRKGKS